MVAVGHHQAARQNADAAFKDAHVDVHLKHPYILAFEKGRGKGDDSGVVGAQKLSHPRQS